MHLSGLLHDLFFPLAENAGRFEPERDVPILFG